MTQSAKCGAPPGWGGAVAPENRVTARSNAPQNKCTGLHLPVNWDRNWPSTRSAWTSAPWKAAITSASYVGAAILVERLDLAGDLDRRGPERRLDAGGL